MKLEVILMGEVIMDNKSYYVSKTRKSKETRYLELEKLDGYKVTPKVKEKDAIGVSQIIFVNDDFSEKIIRKKVDKKIEQLLKQLKQIEEDDGSGDDAIRRSLMDAEKLRLQLINNYVKYLGHTYHSLTLKKLALIVEQLRYQLYVNEFKKQVIYYNDSIDDKKESRRGR